ncbi:MAG: invasion associated locus B family protein [Pelagimonas sp.]|jgi:invasion protein IalB|nr:invasion associated locus B family protein [Pelagimonas sp.]
MKNPLLLISLMAALGAAPALAQETTAQTPAPEAETTEATTEAAPEGTQEGAETSGNGLDLGEAAAPQGPQTYLKATHGDWQIECIELADRDDICQMQQLLLDAAGSPVAKAEIVKLANGGQAVAAGTIAVPLETALREKLTIAVDGNNARKYEYSFCSQIGCISQVGFTAQDIASFKAGAKATLTLVPALAPGQKVQVEMSLTGFTAAYNEVSALTQ